MWNKELKEALLNVCKKHCYQDAENIIVPEPYLPYVPENWNGILVLAESQSSAHPQYWKQVKKESILERMQRLGKYPRELSIGPWDDGTIKLALQAIFEGADLNNLKLEDVAVSNAVPWTRKGTGKNLNPDEQMQAKAAEFWKEIFNVWKPDIKALVVLGNVAKRVMRNAVLEKYRVLELRLPSPNAINRVSGMFNCVDLKTRFPEVEKALHTLKIIEKEKQYQMKVFFACHAVSHGVSEFKKWYGGKNSNLTTNDNG